MMKDSSPFGAPVDVASKTRFVAKKAKRCTRRAPDLAFGCTVSHQQPARALGAPPLRRVHRSRVWAMKGLIQELAHQRRVAWIHRVRLTAMNPNVVATAKGRGVGELIGLAAMFKRRDVVDLEDASLATFLATPAVTVERGPPHPCPTSPVDLRPMPATRRRHG